LPQIFGHFFEFSQGCQGKLLREWLNPVWWAQNVFPECSGGANEPQETIHAFFWETKMSIKRLKTKLYFLQKKSFLLEKIFLREKMFGFSRNVRDS